MKDSIPWNTIVLGALGAGALYIMWKGVSNAEKSIADIASLPVKTVDAAVKTVTDTASNVGMKTEQQTRAAFTAATGYDSYPPVQNILEDMTRNTLAGVSPNFETVSGHQVFVAPPVIAPRSNSVSVAAPTSNHSSAANFSTVSGQSVYVPPASHSTTRGFTIGGIHYG